MTLLTAQQSGRPGAFFVKVRRLIAEIAREGLVGIQSSGFAYLAATYDSTENRDSALETLAEQVVEVKGSQAMVIAIASGENERY